MSTIKQDFSLPQKLSFYNIHGADNQVIECLLDFGLYHMLGQGKTKDLAKLNLIKSIRESKAREMNEYDAMIDFITMTRD